MELFVFLRSECSRPAVWHACLLTPAEPRWRSWLLSPHICIPTVAVGGSVDRVTVVPVFDDSAAEGARASKEQFRASQEQFRASQDQFKTQLTHFDVARAQCTKDEDTQRLLSCIVSLHPSVTLPTDCACSHYPGTHLNTHTSKVCLTVSCVLPLPQEVGFGSYSAFNSLIRSMFKAQMWLPGSRPSDTVESCPQPEEASRRPMSQRISSSAARGSVFQMIRSSVGTTSRPGRTRHGAAGIAGGGTNLPAAHACPDPQSAEGPSRMLGPLEA